MGNGGRGGRAAQQPNLCVFLQFLLGIVLVVWVLCRGCQEAVLLCVRFLSLCGLAAFFQVWLLIGYCDYVWSCRFDCVWISGFALARFAEELASIRDYQWRFASMTTMRFSKCGECRVSEHLFCSCEAATPLTLMRKKNPRCPRSYQAFLTLDRKYSM